MHDISESAHRFASAASGCSRSLLPLHAITKTSSQRIRMRAGYNLRRVGRGVGCCICRNLHASAGIDERWWHEYRRRLEVRRVDSDRIGSLACATGGRLVLVAEPEREGCEQADAEPTDAGDHEALLVLGARELATPEA